MNGRFEIDPARCELGPEIRELLETWIAIDWFVPPRAPQAGDELFTAHHLACRAHAPALFADRLAIRPVSGGWDDFAELCARVRIPRDWDWKFSALKPLSDAHSEAHELVLLDRARPLADGPLHPGELFFRVDDHLIWANLGPALELPAAHTEPAVFYVQYATMDVIEAVEWQLADGQASLAANPFEPLIRCYAAGFYPFCFDRETVVLFSFRG